MQSMFSISIFYQYWSFAGHSDNSLSQNAVITHASINTDRLQVLHKHMQSKGNLEIYWMKQSVSRWIIKTTRTSDIVVEICSSMCFSMCYFDYRLVTANQSILQVVMWFHHYHFITLMIFWLLLQATNCISWIGEQEIL